MKFYIKVHYTEAVRRSFFRYKYIIEPISIGIVSECGKEFYAIAKDFNSRYLTQDMIDNVIRYLPLDQKRYVLSRSMMLESIGHFLVSNNKGQDTIELIFHEDPVGYSAFCGIMGGAAHGEESLIKRTFADLSQSIREYATTITEEEFEEGGEYGLLKIREANQPFTTDQKVEMFHSHNLSPEYRPRRTSLEEALWIRDMDKFFKAAKWLKENSQLSE